MILTISLLCSGRDNSTEKCLSSIKKITDSIGNSEIIVVDTGCNENVKTILYQYADKVIPFTWCDDFSAARNVGLDAASGEWFMFIDDDEWFIDPTPIIKFFKSGKYKAYTRATYRVRNYTDLQGRDFDDSLNSRLFKIGDKKKHRFVGRVHEYYSSIPGNEFHIDCHAEHYGYAFKTEEDRRKHSLRNVPLILKMIEEDPDNIKWPQQLAPEYYGLNEFSKLVDFCSKTLQQIENKNDNVTNTVRPLFYCCSIEGLTKTYDYERAINQCHIALSDNRNSNIAIARILEYEIVLHWKTTKDYNRMLDIANMFFDIYKKRNAQAETTANPFFLVHESYQAKFSNELFVYGAIAAIQTQNYTQALLLFNQIRWEDYPPVTFSLCYLDIITVIGKHDFIPDLSKIINELLSAELTRDIVIKHIMDLCSADKNVLYKFAQYSNFLICEHYYVKYLQLINIINSHQLTNSLDLLVGYLNSTTDFLSNQLLWTEVDNCNIDKKNLLSVVAPRHFIQSVNNFVVNSSVEKIELLYSLFSDCYEYNPQNDNRFEYMHMKLLEGIIKKKPKDSWETDALYQKTFDTWANLCISYYKKYLIEDAMNSNCPLLDSATKEAFLYFEKKD